MFRVWPLLTVTNTLLVSLSLYIPDIYIVYSLKIFHLYYHYKHKGNSDAFLESGNNYD